jgi:hypothetical protein
MERNKDIEREKERNKGGETQRWREREKKNPWVVPLGTTSRNEKGTIYGLH